MNADQPQLTNPSHPVASMQRSGIEGAPHQSRTSLDGRAIPLTIEQRVENLERQVASIVRAGAAKIMAARGADKAPGAALPPPEKPVDPLAGIPDAATAPEVRRVVCAAILKLPHGYRVIGPRHHDLVMQTQDKWAVEAGEYTENSRFPDRENQGFIDQYGVFMTRTEAWQVALAAGQIRYRCGGDTANGGTLYSENLY